ncbi:MAG: transposase [Chloroflexota bacterium]
MTRKGYDTDLNDAEWALLMVTALFSWERTGCQWRLLPTDFPHWTSVHSYFDQWTNDGTWRRINDAIRQQVRTQARRGPEPTAGGWSTVNV